MSDFKGRLDAIENGPINRNAIAGAVVLARDILDELAKVKAERGDFASKLHAIRSKVAVLDGRAILAEKREEKVRAEWARYREAIEPAFREGWHARIYNDIETNEDECWEESTARKALEAERDRYRKELEPAFILALRAFREGFYASEEGKRLHPAWVESEARAALKGEEATDEAE